jgi:hypothetical protein
MKEGVQREQLLRMAQNWEQMAQDRERLTRLHPEIALDLDPSE